jgi:hypothetical protein
MFGADMSTGYRVDRNTLRTNQAFIVALTVLAFVLDDAGRWIILFTAAVMLGGTFMPALALFKQVHQRFLRPAGLLGADVHIEDPMPHQFAQAFGGVVLVASFIALLGGAAVVGWTLSWIVTALAFVNLTIQFCVGCFVYYQLDRFGMLPRVIAANRATR